MFCGIDELTNESEVEQKFLWHLLTTPTPTGLGFCSVDIRTKTDIRRLRIGKGNSSKLYLPDYVIVLSGIPVVVIEAKHPDEDVHESLREARLYANELNASLPTGINPCARVVASNGIMTVSSAYDTDTPDLALEFEDFDLTNEKHEAFIRELCRSTCQKVVNETLGRLTSRPLFQAKHFLGGQSVRNEDVGYNEFGSQFALDYRTVFNPESRQDRIRIVREAYIPSKRREHYVDEIDRIVRTAVASTVPGAKSIENTSDPVEILDALRQGKTLENKVMLLVGARGSGKTTFVDYCREVKLPTDLRESTIWCHLDLNEAPPGSGTLQEQWLLNKLIVSLESAYPEVRFRDREYLEKVFGLELRDLRRGPLAGLAPGSEAYETRVADRLAQLTGDKLTYALALCRYLCGGPQRLLIIVFDNCDKRERDDQLKAFQAARWLQSEIRCLVVLPLRDITYETYRDCPPLDTAIKDLVFRIDSPSFSRILRRRVDMVLRDLKVNSSARMLHYTWTFAIFQTALEK